MSLTTIVSNELRSAKNFLLTPKEKSDMVSYLVDSREIKPYLQRFSEQDRRNLYARLEHHVQTGFEKYGKYMGTWTQKAANITSTTSAISQGYQLSGLAQAVYTGAQYSPLHAYMFLAKTAAETPSMVRYLIASKDYWGALKWFAMKPLEALVPVLGPLMGIGMTQRIMRQRIMYEAKNNFLTELKKLDAIAQERPYVPLDQHAEKTTGYKIQPKYAPVGFHPAYA